jgi:PLP dependent protein
MSAIKENLEAVRERIAHSAVSAGRNPEEITLVAVSKTHPAEAVRSAIECGQTVFGENKVQEGEWKRPESGGGEWHLIGHLQSNKVRKAVKTFDVIETVDSVELAQRIDRICGEEGRGKIGVFVQVDLGGEESKTGAEVSEIPNIIATVNESTNLVFKGLMTIPPFFDDPEEARPFFARLRELRDELAPSAGLSMGMSHDMEVAIEEGATVVRVGTAIFGVRPRAESEENSGNAQ